MATSTEELVGALTTAQAGTAEARAQSEQAMTVGRALAEEAAAHGWEGVVATMESALTALEGVIGSLGSGETAGQGVAELLQAVVADVSRADVAEHLGSSLPELEKAVAAVEGAGSAADATIAAAEQAGGPAGFLALMTGVRETLAGCLGALSDCRQQIEAEIATSGGWGN